MRNAHEHGVALSPVKTRTHKGVEVEIRPIRLDDAQEVLDLERALIEHEVGEVRTLDDLNESVLGFEEELTVYTAANRRPQSMRIVADSNGVIVGSAQAWRLPPSRLRHVAEFSVGVLPPYQGRGLGRTLIEQILTWCLEGPGAQTPSISRIQLQVRADNEGAIELYKKLGFYVEGTMKDFVQTGTGTFVDNLLMVHGPAPIPKEHTP